MKHILFIAVFIATTMVSTAQVSIGITTPDPSAILHLEANGSQGLLLPRMTTTERDANLKSPAVGIVIYNTTDNQFQVVTNGSGWKSLASGTSSNIATGMTTNVGQVGIGTSTPDPNTILDVSSTNKGVLLPLLTADPALVAGLLYYHTGTNKVRGCNGTAWVDLN